MSEPSTPLKAAVVSRRRILTTLTAATVAGGSVFAGVVPLAPSLYAGTIDATPSTPAEALARLESGNERFVRGQSQEIHRDLDRVRQVADRQTPFAAFLGCADSRVPIEIVFDQGFGDLFVTRIAGNVVTSEILGSLEFGTRVLGAKVLYVLGHSACGAVSATLQGNEVPGQISSLFQHIRPAVKVSGGDLNRAIEENVRNQALILAEASPVIARLVRDGELVVAGGIYNLQTGKVQPVVMPD